MLAAVISAFGGPDVLAVREVPTPRARSHEVLVRVRGSALNRADVLQRLGRYPAPPDAPRDIPGIEFAGEVVELGSDASRVRPGERVFGIVGGGAHAEYLTVHEDAIVRVPDTLSWREAAAVPEAFITAHDAMIAQADLAPGGSVLIHAVASGVGLAAVQLAVAAGARVFGTTRSRDKLDAARALGLTGGAVLDGDLSSLGHLIAEWTGGQGVDIVLDLLGGSYLSASLACLAPRGRLMAVGTLAGAQASIDLRLVLTRRLSLIGTVLRSRPLSEKIAVARRFESEVAPLLASGAVKPVVDSSFPLAEIAAAHRRMESNLSVGKVVLEI
jgi:putative PIG3 family NAD(P)H quinone oxidoreductase